MSFFRNVIFDLDDTLLDTSGSLIPAAARRAVEAMGATADQSNAWLARRSEILRTNPRANVWLDLAKGDTEMAERGRRAFLTFPIESLPKEALRFTPGAKEILQWTRERSKLFLVTSGDATTQQAKVAHLGIEPFFESIHVVDSSNGARAKNEAFARIAESLGDKDISPANFVSVGNRVDTDLGSAKMLGWKTAWIRYGEHASLLPQNALEIPDFEVASLSDLLSIWREREGLWKT